MPKYDKHISDLAWCAVRYSLGRMTYVSELTPEAVEALFDKIDTQTLFIIKRDIEECDFFGMECDQRSWKKFHANLCAELEKRDH